MSNFYSAHRVNYSLRAHKRDAFIEFIKSQLLGPFSLHIRPLTAREVSSLVPESPATLTAPLSSDLAADMSAHSSMSDLSMLAPANDQSAIRDHYASVFASLERLVKDHQLEQDKKKPESRLQMLVPTLGKFFTGLPLREAFLAHDDKLALSARRHVPPSFNEIRAILNTAQLMALAPSIQLITFDGDVTLYDDGCNLESDSIMVQLLVSLLTFTDLNVAIVTAAGYVEAEKYEHRLRGLLDGFQHYKLPAEAVTKFWVMGGECNYLFRCRADYHLESVQMPFLPETYFHHTLARRSSDVNLAAAFVAGSTASGNGSDSGGNLPALASTASGATSSAASHTHASNSEAAAILSTPMPNDQAVTRLLDVAEQVLHRCHANMRLPGKVIRKPRAVGIIPNAGEKMTREQLDECVLSLQHALQLWQRAKGTAIPFCAFNGGSDVWVDIGNKLIGVKIVAEYIGVHAANIVHVGDQFLSTGNDYAARRGCPTLWIASPKETAEALRELIGMMRSEGRKEVGGEVQMTG
ncbi:IMP-specific 5'-nucleotidase-domain-containing protein [Catenaria anguillulae PL171]|uniref:IMP-specific 5'-nucleotidase 1 n=1 Tax=Catenaria anguillulae PL171 TaxID=765915 RepID=A0A1Y2HIC3_9FUNG|nr:IMP-specific 5'-nucleotidase-domain-containing protein [Catenaria anguillulae PL171]